MTSDYLSQDQVATLFPGLTPQRLTRWRWAKTGPAYVRAGRQRLYRHDAVVTWLEQNQVTHSGASS